MAGIVFKSNIDLGQLQLLNAAIHNTSSDPGSPVEGQIWLNTTTHLFKIYRNGSTHVIADLSNSLSDFTAPTGDLSINSHKLTNVSTPTSASDAATKGYVDGVALGLDFKDSVRAASTANVTVASALVNGFTMDGITLATADRVLLKNQTSAIENGIYIVAASGAASRASDCNSNTNYTTGAFVYVEQGTANGGTAWVVSTAEPFSVGVDSITWTQFSASTTYTGSGAINVSGTVISVNTDGTTIYVNGSNNLAVKSSGTSGQTLISAGSGDAAWGAVPLGNANAVSGALPINRGGTGQTTAAAALAALGGTTKFAADIGDNSTTSIVVTHNLATKDCSVTVRDNTTPFDQFQVEVQYTTTNTVTLVFAVAPTTNQYRCIVIG